MEKLIVDFVESFDYTDNEPGYQHDIILSVIFAGKKYYLVYQPTEPIYLSAEWIERKNNGYTVGEYSLYLEDGHADDIIRAIMSANDLDRDAAIEMIYESCLEIVNREAEHFLAENKV